MNYELKPSLIPVNGQLVEAYSRLSRATSEIREELGLPTAEDLRANIGIAPIEEYIILQAVNINKNDEVYWRLDTLQQPIKIESIYVSSPQADRFDFQILDSSQNVVFTLSLSRNKTPYELPVSVLPPEFTIKIRARDGIQLLRIACKPAVILEYINGSPTFNSEA